MFDVKERWESQIEGECPHLIDYSCSVMPAENGEHGNEEVKH